jgi:hypothetical protein
MSFLSNIPGWVKTLTVLVVIIILCVLVKVNLSGNIGSNGIGINLTQGLVK